jgi:hypothetical protein
MEISLLIAAGIGIVIAGIFCWFEEVLTPEDFN